MRIWLLGLFFFYSVSSAESFANALLDEESPYLQQHAHNPIQWYAWGEEAFQKAKKEHKPIFLSIGYSTCHWCHVMARESFENEAMAKIFNQYFISIKVDREEMPQIDSYYQNIYQKVRHRSGGWPLSVIMSEDKEPFFITTYIPNVPKYGVEGLDTTLLNYANMYHKNKTRLNKRIAAIKALQERTVAGIESESKNAKEIFNALKAGYDALYFGFDIAPKFPEASKIELLFVLSELGFLEAKTMALNVLRTMVLRGIYDQVDGGFFRYCVDANWEIPHFEKMLYNQAELIPLYIKAYQITKDELYRDIVIETINMVYERFEKDGVFYSASNAEVNGEEGGYFVYSVDEIDKALQHSDVNGTLRQAMEFRHKGNFGRSVHLGFYSQNRPKGFKTFKEYLKALRKPREYPFIDTKIILSWNTMMVEALFDAAAIDEKYAFLAQISLNKLTALLQKKEQLYHQSLGGNKAYVKGLLEDYAGMIAANITAYESTYQRTYLDNAEMLMQQALQKFYDEGKWFLSEDVPKVDADLKDKYYTAALGVMLQNMQRLAAINDSLRLQSIAETSLQNISDRVFEDPAYAPSNAIAFLMQRYGVVALKHQQQMLLRYRDDITAIAHPFVVTKVSDSSKEFLACKVGQCFSYSHDFYHVKKDILKTLQIK